MRLLPGPWRAGPRAAAPAAGRGGWRPAAAGPASESDLPAARRDYDSARPRPMESRTYLPGAEPDTVTGPTGPAAGRPGDGDRRSGSGPARRARLSQCSLSR